MKFVFVSHGLNAFAINKLKDFTNKDFSKTKVLYIDTPAKTYPPDPKWLTESINELIDIGFVVDRFDIEQAYNEKTNVTSLITKYDIVAVSGGNVFYFLYWAEKIGLAMILRKFMRKGGIYFGESAGVVCHIKDIEPLKLGDEPDKAPAIVNHGLELTDLIVIPHWGNPKYDEIMKKIRNEYSKQGLITHVLKDGEVMFVKDDNFEIVEP